MIIDNKPLVTEGTVNITLKDFTWLDKMAKVGQQLSWLENLQGEYEELEKAYKQLQEEYTELHKKKMALKKGGNL